MRRAEIEARHGKPPPATIGQKARAIVAAILVVAAFAGAKLAVDHYQRRDEAKRRQQSDRAVQDLMSSEAGKKATADAIKNATEDGVKATLKAITEQNAATRATSQEQVQKSAPVSSRSMSGRSVVCRRSVRKKKPHGGG